MLMLFPKQGSSDSKCNWVMDSLARGWPGAATANPRQYTAQPSAFWGFIQNNEAIIRQHQAEGVDWWFWDMPFWGRWNGLVEALNPQQEFYWRVSKNAVHPTRVIERPADRFERWGVTATQEQGQGHVLVCPSSETMTRWTTGMSAKAWTEETVRTIKQHTDREVRVRYKPRAGGTSGPAAVQLAGMRDLWEDLVDCHAMVTCISLGAVEAALKGIPVFCSASSYAAPINAGRLDEIESPAKLDIQAWLNHLAYCQFTHAEIEDGTAWRILCE